MITLRPSLFAVIDCFFSYPLSRSSRLTRSPRPLVFDTANVEHDSYVGDDDGVILAEAVAVAASPLELQRVAEDFNATEFNYTEQVCEGMSTPP